ncbi:SDR family NAD(P)-dependent oxidoreductase [Neobacillus mesonae]|nr:SDR family NAD(P)-dependent oxidoreductase [Neobacillus mesonae]
MTWKKTACVTGADRGLGLSLTVKLLESGYIVFAGRYMEDWDSLDRLKEKYPESLHIIPLDISSDQSVKAAAELIEKETAYLDLLINNAGVTNPADHRTVLEELDYEVMTHIYNINTLGPLRVTQSLMKLITQGSEKLIVNISSEAGSVARNKRTDMFGYCMSKSALNMQSSIVHQLVREIGGQVMVFYPGWLKSYMSGELNSEAAVEPDESAYKIMGLISRHLEFISEQPIFLDYEGNEWPW